MRSLERLKPSPCCFCGSLLELFSSTTATQNYSGTLTKPWRLSRTWGFRDFSHISRASLSFSADDARFGAFRADRGLIVGRRNGDRALEGPRHSFTPSGGRPLRVSVGARCQLLRHCIPGRGTHFVRSRTIPRRRFFFGESEEEELRQWTRTRQAAWYAAPAQPREAEAERPATEQGASRSRPRNIQKCRDNRHRHQYQ